VKRKWKEINKTIIKNREEIKKYIKINKNTTNTERSKKRNKGRNIERN
jgi:hypothetical protein